jgi:hypothetical protein
MTVKISELVGTAGTYKIVNDSDSNATAEVNVTGGSGRIYSIRIKNDASSNASYVKFKLTTGTTTVGTTEPDMMLIARASVDEKYIFPGGLPFDQLTFWSTATSATNNSGAPPSTDVTILST